MAKNAVILLNMGGPNNLQEVELFLKNMFADKNILTMKSDLLRKFVGSMIVFSRTESSQEIYRELGGKSPIVDHTKKLVEKLQKRVGSDVIVDFVMRYTPPFASEVIQRIEQEGVDRIYLIPLYPHYSTTTTKSSLEDFEAAYHKADGDAILVEIKHFFQNQLYNDAILERIEEKMVSKEYENTTLIFSAHGLPQKIVDRGDVYEKHIKKHTELLKELLQKRGMNFQKVELAYQSKLGPMEWLRPSLDEKLEECRKENILIFPIAFTIDNSETDYELHKEYKEIAQELGIENYNVCSCPNDSEKFVDALEDIYKKMI